VKSENPAVPGVAAIHRLALTIREAAAACGMAEPTLRDAVRRGEVAVVSIGQGRLKGRYLILPDDLEAYLHRLRRPAVGESGTVGIARTRG
jgi:hypothetical protein